jgi:DNA-binding LacI/PurR family transcriptional regulator
MMSYPFYKEIYDALLGEINSGKLPEGSRIPSEKELCRTYKVSRITSKHALELLAEQGYITRYPGKGSFVNGRLSAKPESSSLMPSMIAFLTTDFSDAFGTKLLYGVLETCTVLGYQLILKRTRDRLDEEEEAIKELAKSDVGGILILPVHGEYYNSEILNLILNKKAVVFVDRRMKGLAAPAIATDNVAAAELGVEYLIKLGHRNIGFYSGPVTNSSSTEDRCQGFIKAFARLGVIHNPAYFCHKLTSTWNYPFHAREHVEADINMVAEHLKTNPGITAAFVTEYDMAIIVKAAAENLGRQIPAGLSILTFDSPYSYFGVSPFTCIIQDEHSIGKQAVEILHGIINGVDPMSVGNILVSARLVKGSSTCPKKRNTLLNNTIA